MRISPHFLEPKEAHYNYDYFSSVSYVFDQRRPVGGRVVSLLRNGRPVGEQEKLTLCLCDYRATGAGDFDFYRDCPRIREIQVGISELILNYLREHETVEIPPEHPYRVILP